MVALYEVRPLQKGSMIRFTITHENSMSGLRMLTFANQGRNFYDSQADAQVALELYRGDLRRKILGHAADSLEVRRVDCYDNGDARSIFFDL